jgi:hypothetical protein
MNKAYILVLALVLLLGQNALAGGYAAKTGDSGFDMYLSDLNVSARTDIGGFKSRLSLQYGVPEARIGVMLNKHKMAPADVYMAIRISSIAGISVDVVMGQYRANRGNGWGAIAKNLGIKPGSREFHTLKQSDKDIFKGKSVGGKKNRKSKGRRR